MVKTINDLPVEIISRTFLHFDIKTLNALYKVSKKHHELIKQDTPILAANLLKNLKKKMFGWFTSDKTFNNPLPVFRFYKNIYNMLTKLKECQNSILDVSKNKDIMPYIIQTSILLKAVKNSNKTDYDTIVTQFKLTFIHYAMMVSSDLDIYGILDFHNEINIRQAHQLYTTAYIMKTSGLYDEYLYSFEVFNIILYILSNIMHMLTNHQQTHVATIQMLRSININL